MKQLLLTTVSALLIGGCCSPSNMLDVKAAACARWREVGYECVGYEGFQWGLWLGGKYGGAYVWHSLKRKDAPGIIYTGATQRWGNEIHVYGPKAIDALKGE